MKLLCPFGPNLLRQVGLTYIERAAVHGEDMYDRSRGYKLSDRSRGEMSADGRCCLLLRYPKDKVYAHRI